MFCASVCVRVYTHAGVRPHVSVALVSLILCGAHQYPPAILPPGLLTLKNNEVWQRQPVIDPHCSVFVQSGHAVVL